MLRLSALGDSANELLNAFSAQLVTDNPDFDLSGNSYVGAGEIPWDAPGLFVYLGGGHSGQPGMPMSTDVRSVNAFTFSVQFYVQLLREVATFGYWNDSGVNPAPDDVLNGNGVQAINDAGALLRAAVGLKAAGNLVRREAGFVIGQVTPVGPMGGMAAMRLQLDLSVEVL